MTLTEALAELGLDPTADAETIRRTYLRLIKTRKPESDPEGFRRAREAFEIARAAGELVTFAAESARRHAWPPAGQPDAPGARTAGGDAPPGAATASDGTSPTDDVFAGLLTALRSLPASAGIKARLEIARQAVVALPRDPRAYWLVVTTLSELGTDEELAEALRAGHRAGWIEFLEALLVRVPRLATGEEIDEALRAPSTTLRLAAAAALARRDSARATAAVIDVVGAARAAADAEIPVGRLLGVILTLHEAGATSDAVAAHAALRALLQDHGLELSLLRGPLGGVWALAGELAALPADFPAALRRSFAVATRAGDLQSAFYDACFHVRSDRREVLRWWRRIQVAAPNVAATLQGALAREDALGRKRRNRISPAAWLIAPLLIGVVRLCASTDAPTSHHYATDPMPIMPVREPIALPASLEIAREAAVTLCGADWSTPGRLSCDDVRAALDALASGDCALAKEKIRGLKLALQGNPATEAESRVLTGSDLCWWQRCPGRQEGEGSGSAGSAP